MQLRLPVLALAVGCFWCSAPFAPRVFAGNRKLLVQQDSLTDESLKSLLDGMGLEPKKLSKGYLIAIKREAWTYNMQLVLSGDGTKLGINANLGVVDKPEEVPASAWLALLQANSEIDPSSFYFEKEQKKLYLHRVLDNRGLTAVVVRKQVEAFCDNLKSTGDLWKFTK